jgi:hypothetical protein
VTQAQVLPPQDVEEPPPARPTRAQPKDTSQQLPPQKGVCMRVCVYIYGPLWQSWWCMGVKNVKVCSCRPALLVSAPPAESQQRRQPPKERAQGQKHKRQQQVEVEEAEERPEPPSRGVWRIGLLRYMLVGSKMPLLAGPVEAGGLSGSGCVCVVMHVCLLHACSGAWREAEARRQGQGQAAAGQGQEQACGSCRGHAGPLAR